MSKISELSSDIQQTQTPKEIKANFQDKLKSLIQQFDSKPIFDDNYLSIEQSEQETNDG